MHLPPQALNPAGYRPARSFSAPPSDSPFAAALAKPAGAPYLVRDVTLTQGCGTRSRVTAPVSALSKLGGRSSPAAA